ncbi:hypothetical protein F5Y19DRAFT_185426 [Xylariaceae sp. FL1651]|nr:hypothetical protein F5Y19DRAFT_185426 [Xylariaceae sp. FL1651]
MHAYELTILSAQAKTAALVRIALADNAITDDILFSIAALSYGPNNKLAELAQGEPTLGLFDSPVKHLSLNGILSRGEFAPEHFEMLHMLVEARGGLKAVELAGVAELLQYFDVLRASLELRRPRFVLCQTNQLILDHHIAEARALIPRVECCDANPDLESILADMRVCCQLIELHSTAKLDSKLVVILPQVSVIMQHRILSLPVGRDEVCRLATLIFSYGVTFPIMDPRPIKTLADQLREILKQPSQTKDHDKRTILWATMLGAIASANTELEQFFAWRIRLLSKTMKVYHWLSVKSMLRGFVWLDRACDQGGQTIWSKSVSQRKIIVASVGLR